MASIEVFSDELLLERKYHYSLENALVKNKGGGIPLQKKRVSNMPENDSKLKDADHPI